MTSCLPPSKKYEVTDPFYFTCNESNKRYFKAPTKIEKVKRVIADTDKPLVLIPVVLVNKFICKMKHRSRHMCVFVLNKINNTLERIDIKRYHLKEYNMKLVYARLNNMLDALGYEEDARPKLLNEVDINVTFQKKHAFARADSGYPAFLLAYVKIMNDHPELSQSKMVSLVNRMNSKKLEDLWKAYVAFRKEHEDNPCPDEGMVRNMENGRCMKPLSKTYVSLLKEKPPKPCKQKQVYSTILQKCVAPKRNVDIDILEKEALTTKYNPNQKMTHIDSSAVFSAHIITYLASKYHYAKFILPSLDSYKKIEKESFKVRWTINKSGPELAFPHQYWEMFKQHMLDPSCRFIITMLSLRHHSDGQHANALIYDKSSNEFERFDPLTVNIHERYKVDDLDEKLKAIIASKSPEVFPKPAKYFEPAKYCPKSRVFQSMEVSEIPGVDLRGNCAVWNWWYINVRIANPSVKRKDIVDIASKKLETMGGLYKFIKSYQKYLLGIAKRKH